MEPRIGFEPMTLRLQGGCSGQLSYQGDVSIIDHLEPKGHPRSHGFRI
jgi:hypothetical protein